MATKKVRDTYNKKRRQRTFDTTPPRGSKHKPVPKLITITLQMRHSVNGKAYGPGIVQVSQGKAEAFMNTEHAAIQKELEMHQQQAFIVGFNRQGGMYKRQVPWAQFDTILGRE